MKKRQKTHVKFLSICRHPLQLRYYKIFPSSLLSQTVYAETQSSYFANCMTMRCENAFHTIDAQLRLISYTAIFFKYAVMILVYVTIGVWTGRARAFFDHLPPWSLYKVFSGISWLLALSALVKSGTPVSTSLRALRRDSNRYLKERIDKTLVFVNNGDNLGQALYKTGLDYPDPEIINDLKIYSELDNFEDALENLATEWLDESVYMIENKASILNMVAILTVAAIIAWAVMGTFEMQDQITSSMGL